MNETVRVMELLQNSEKRRISAYAGIPAFIYIKIKGTYYVIS
jgi:hypothetical protein